MKVINKKIKLIRKMKNPIIKNRAVTIVYHFLECLNGEGKYNRIVKDYKYFENKKIELLKFMVL